MKLRKLICGLLVLSAGHLYGAFGYYTDFSVDFNKVPNTDQSNFAVLINTTDNRFKTTGNGGHVQDPNGFDLRPYSDTGLTTSYTYQLEFYSASTGQVVM